MQILCHSSMSPEHNHICRWPWVCSTRPPEYGHLNAAASIVPSAVAGHSAPWSSPTISGVSRAIACVLCSVGAASFCSGYQRLSMPNLCRMLGGGDGQWPSLLHQPLTGSWSEATRTSTCQPSSHCLQSSPITLNPTLTPGALLSRSCVFGTRISLTIEAVLMGLAN